MLLNVSPLVDNYPAKHRYTGPGCNVMVASFYLLRKLLSLTSSCEVRLFEGFVSFKPNKQSHEEDVEALRKVVREKDSIIPVENLKANKNDKLTSAFDVMGLDVEVPPVILVTNDSLQKIPCCR